MEYPETVEYGTLFVDPEFEERMHLGYPEIESHLAWFEFEAETEGSGFLQRKDHWLVL
jgi:hypothetical protein